VIVEVVDSEGIFLREDLVRQPGVDNRAMRPAIYILTNWSNRVLYVGVTANLAERHWIHTHSLNPGSFSARYNTTKLVYYEAHSSMKAAIVREKQLKKGSRAAKIRLIERANPTWRDLAADLYE